MFFFFKQKTAYEMRISDWSSDVCSSDLTCVGDPLERHALLRQGHPERHANRSAPTHALQYALAHSDQAHAVVNTAWPEPPLRDLESSAFAKIGRAHV